MSKKSFIQVVGETEDGIKIVSGVFKLFDTNGLPLDIVFDLCKQSNMIPSWTHFYNEALEYGWSKKTVLNRLHDNINDVYGKDYRDIVIRRLELL